LTTTFEGTGLSVTFEAANSTTDYEVIVDGQRLVANKIELVSGEKTYPVVTGLPAGQHTATVHRRTEASTGAVVFKGFSVTGGALVPTPSPFAHRIEFVGDSITCGYGTECKTATEAFSTKTENHWLTFGAGASRLLAADGHFISWSGKGMVNNYGNDQSPRMPELFPRTYGAEATPLWDFAAWKPEVVVINLGTNDWNGGIDTATEIESFKTAYRAFIDQLAVRYPGVVVFGIGNAIVGKSHTEAVKTVMEGYASPSRRYLLFSVKSAEGSGCYHPSAATHARWADELAAAIQDATGW
jgi:lysophospholipase L1-like esterase